MAYPQVVDGGDSLQSWVVTAGVLNGKSQLTRVVHHLGDPD